MSLAYTTYSKYKSVAEYFIPVKTSSAFHEQGVLTPKEFEEAGDLLVNNHPSWSWQAPTDPSKLTPHLSPDKQYLIIRAVPCLKRADALDVDGDEQELEGDGGEGEGWLDTHKDRKAPVDEEVADMTISVGNMEVTEPEDLDDDDCPDMEDFDEIDNNVVTDDACCAPAAQGGNPEVVKSRTYDLTITYDKYFQTPRVWLFGYTEDGLPLNKDQVFEDIYSDYKNKTATIETHPYQGHPCVSIHPCRHAETMKRMIDRLNERANPDGGEPVKLRPDLYLLVFLKFIQAVIPTVEYDLGAIEL